MEAMHNYEVEIRELFGQLTAEIPGSTRFRAINLEGFAMAIGLMMNEAFYQGQQNVVQTSELVFSQAFSHAL